MPRSRLLLALPACALLAATSTPAVPPAAAPQFADTIYHHGTIITQTIKDGAPIWTQNP